MKICAGKFARNILHKNEVNKKFCTNLNYKIIVFLLYHFRLKLFCTIFIC